MYTIGYRLLENTVGKEWADKISKNCNKKGCTRLRIPLPHQRQWKKRFYRCIGDDDIADRIIHSFGGQRLVIKKISLQAKNRIARRAVNILIDNNFSQEEIELIMKSNINSNIKRPIKKKIIF